MRPDDSLNDVLAVLTLAIVGGCCVGWLAGLLIGGMM